jgi:hypothetical protein
MQCLNSHVALLSNYEVVALLKEKKAESNLDEGVSFSRIQKEVC